MTQANLEMPYFTNKYYMYVPYAWNMFIKSTVNMIALLPCTTEPQQTHLVLACTTDPQQIMYSFIANWKKNIYTRHGW
jgi:hypothetical protein